ncbi:MAG: acyltransferase [Aestuariivita sp.]|nr:acyltransferase [Aestuariivita sp.]
MKKWTARKILYLAGWKIDPTNPPHARCVVIAAPHTSNWDFPMMILFTSAFGLEIKWMGKNSIFIGPVGYFLRKLGGIPIIRNKSNNLVSQMIELFGKSQELMLVVPAEGTRSRSKNWKSGFYHIAHGAEVPVLPTFLDYGNKRGGFGLPIKLTGKISADMDKIRAFYEPYRGKYPELSGPIQLSEEGG